MDRRKTWMAARVAALAIGSTVLVGEAVAQCGYCSPADSTGNVCVPLGIGYVCWTEIFSQNPDTTVYICRGLPIPCGTGSGS